jgi:hypothetical protein
MGWTVRGSDPGGVEIFRTLLEWSRDYPGFCTMGTGSVPGVKQPGRGLDLWHPSSTDVKPAELHLHSPSGPSRPVLGWILLYILRGCKIIKRRAYLNRFYKTSADDAESLKTPTDVTPGPRNRSTPLTSVECGIPTRFVFCATAACRNCPHQISSRSQACRHALVIGTGLTGEGNVLRGTDTRGQWCHPWAWPLQSTVICSVISALIEMTWTTVLSRATVL